MGITNRRGDIRTGIATGVTAKVTTRLATIAPLATNTYDNGINGVGATITINAFGVLADIDDVPPIVGDRILIKDEVIALKNGFYDFTTQGTGSTSAVLTRSINADEDAEVGANTNAFVSTGTANADILFSLTTNEPFSIGIDNLTFEPATGVSALIGGADTQIQFNNAGSFGGDPNFVWDNTNNRLGVGITPAVRLDVASPDPEAVRIRRTGASTPGDGMGISFYLENTDSNPIEYTSINTQIINATPGSEAGELVFHTKVGGATSPRMRLTSTGRLGIGGSPVNPAAMLHVQGEGSDNATDTFIAANSVSTYFKLRNDKRIIYLDDNEGLGKVLTSDASGIATWQTPAGGGIYGGSGTVTGATTVTLATNTVLKFVPTNNNGHVLFESFNGAFGIITKSDFQGRGMRFMQSNGTTRGVDIGAISSTGGLIQLSDAAGSAIVIDLRGASTTSFINRDISFGHTGVPSARLHTQVSTSEGSNFIAKFEGGSGSVSALMIRDDGTISIGTSTPNAESLLELRSTTKALRFTEMSTAQRTAMTGASGFIVLDTTLGFTFYHTGSAWVQL